MLPAPTEKTASEPVVGSISGGGLIMQEKMKREDAVRSSDRLLKEGRELYANGDYESAVRKYRASLDTMPFGAETEDRRKAVAQHLQDGSVALSQNYRRTGKYDEARSLLEEMEAADPGNEAAREGLEYLDDPIRTSPGLTYQNTKDVAEVRRSLYKGEGLYDLGQYDKAEEEFKKVIRKDPSNKAARRGLERAAAIKSDYYRAAYDETRAKMLMEVDKSWELAVPPVDAGASESAEDESDKKRRGVASKMQSIILPELDLNNATVEEAMAILEQGALAHDPDGEGIKLDVRKPKVVDSGDVLEGGLLGDAQAPSDVKIDKLYLTNVPLQVAAQYVAEKAKMRYRVDDGKVTFLPLTSDETDDVVTRRWTVPASFEDFIDSSGGIGGEGDPFASGDDSKVDGEEVPQSVLDKLKMQGVVFPEGSSVSLLSDGRTMVVRNTPSQLDLVDAIVSASLSFELPPVGDVAGSVTIAAKHQQIVVPVVDFNDTTVEEALDFLRVRSIELDSGTLDEANKGINFVLEPGEDGKSLADVKIPSLKMENATISEVLEALSKQAGLGIQMDEWAIVLEPESKKKEDWEPEVDGVGISKEANSKLVDTILPVLDFNNTTLGEGLDFLNVRSHELSGTENSGVEFVFEDESLGDLVVDQLYLSRVPLSVASKYIAEKTGTRYRVKDGKVVFYSDRPIVKKKSQSFETLTSEKADSTFSLNVSDVSFKLAKSSLAEGKWPEAAKVRPEEFVNALNYDDRKPSQSEKVAYDVEQGAHPFMQQRNLMRVSMSTAALGRNASTPLRLTILLDQSGSMERADRAESVKRAFALLTDQLNAGDEITLVGFARTPRLLAERVKGNESKKLLEIVSRTLTEGGTNLEGALDSGIQLAKQQFVDGAQNRIILLTDGAANLGDALPANLAKQVEEMRQAGIAFDACGVGADGLNDEILSSLAKQGDGRYYFLDRPEDADDGFARQIAGALRPAAKNVKVQVIFNPKRVSKFKLYGFEKHLLKKEDFRNDTVDAAEMAAEESGVALYHFEALPEGEGDVGHISVRFLDTATDQMVERKWNIPYEENVTSFTDSDPALRLAGTAALFAEKLKGSAVGERVQLKELRKEADSLQGTYQNQPRFQELRTMLQQAGE